MQRSIDVIFPNEIQFVIELKYCIIIEIQKRSIVYKKLRIKFE